MNNWQLYLAIGLPTLAVLTSMGVSLIQIFDIKGDIREIRSSLGTFKDETHTSFIIITQRLTKLEASLQKETVTK